VTLKVTPKQGTPFEILANHTLNEGQIAWWKAGSALNLMGKQGVAAH